jgi:hypothetical protein
MTDTTVDPTQPAPTAPADAEPTGPIVARAGSYYRRMRYIMVTLMVGVGCWFLYDGFVGWPRQNARYDEIVRRQMAAPENSPDRAAASAELKKHGARREDHELLTQKIIGFGLPVASVAYLLFILHRSRGEVRFDNDVIHAPGHPPIPLTAITDIDKRLWDRKGIARISYEADGKSGVLTLDDFIYDQKPIDRIYDKVIAYAKAQSAETNPAAEA